jgi:hypothetical protein
MTPKCKPTPCDVFAPIKIGVLCTACPVRKGTFTHETEGVSKVIQVALGRLHDREQLLGGDLAKTAFDLLQRLSVFESEKLGKFYLRDACLISGRSNTPWQIRARLNDGAHIRVRSGDTIVLQIKKCKKLRGPRSHFLTANQQTSKLAV